MDFPSLVGWMLRALGLAAQRSTSSRRTRSAYQRSRPLQVTRLEERRVLNGAPTAVLSGEGVLTVSTNVTDGSAAAIHMKTVPENGHSALNVNVNGQTAYHGDSEQIQAIHIAGSSGSDTLIIDFSGGNPIPRGGLVFNGQGQAAGAADSLRMIGGSFSGVNYSITGASSGAIQLAAGTSTSVVALQNIEQVNDSLNAATRSFQFSTAPDNVTLSASMEAGHSQVNISGQSHFIFQNPTEKLSLNTDQGPHDADSVTIDGVGGNFQADLEVKGDAADQVSFAGRTAIGSSDLHVTSGRIDLHGAVVTDGGDVDMYATSKLNIAATGSIETRAADVGLHSVDINVAGRVAAINGGAIELNAGFNGSLLVSGQIDTSTTQPGAHGGTVYLLGSQIGLFGNAVVNASGTTGGGTILVGGDAHGANAAILNAAGTYIGTGVTLNANAGSIGNGGKIVIWSDRSTIFLGALSARGGVTGGNGGFAEVSGGQLRARGEYDLGAPAGERGTLLFDPLEIQIVGGTADGSDDTDALNNQLLNDAGSNTLGSILFADEGAGSPSPFVIYESEIESTDADIILEAARNITTSGTFTNSDVVLMNDRNLTLRTRNSTLDGAGGIDLTGSTDGSNLLFRTQGAGTITIAGATESEAAGNITLGKLQTDGQAIDIVTNNGTVTFTGDVTTGAGTVSVSATGAISQSTGSIVAETINAKTLNDGGSGITLTSATNNAVAINLQTRNAADTANAAGMISYHDSDGFDVAKISTTANATLRSGGAVTQSNSIDAAGLELLGSGPYTLNNAANAVTTLAGNVTGNVEFRDSDGLSVGTVNTAGLTAANVTLTTGDTINQNQAIQTGALVAKTLNNGGAAITLTNAANAVTSIDLRSRNAADNANAAGAISYSDADSVSVTAIQTTSSATLIAGGAITQTGAILANAFLARTLNNSGATITLNNASNAVTSVELSSRNAADSANAAGAISYRDTNGVDVVAIQTTSSAGIVAGGAITQTGAIAADSLVVKTLNNAGAAITLDTIVNAVTSIDLRTRNAADTANASGTITYRDGDGVNVTAIQTTNSATITAGDAITQTGAILANALTAKTRNEGGAAITLTSASNAVASIDLRARNAADSANAAGAISYRDSDGFSVTAVQTTSSATLTAGNAITQTGPILADALVVKTLNNAGANVTLTNAANAVSSIDLRTRNAADTANAAGAITYRDSDGISIAALQTTGAAGVVAGDAITQTGAILANALTAKTLNNAGAAITLNNTGNAVASVDLRARDSADAANVAGAISYRDSDGFSVTAIQTTSSANLTAGDSITQTGAILADAVVVKTLNNSGASITLTDAANAVTTIDLRSRNAADSANVAGTISYRDLNGFDVVKISTTANATLNSGAAVTQSGSIESVGLELLGAGPYTLSNAGNDITTLAGNVTNAVTYRDANGVTIGTVNTVGLAASSVSITAGAAFSQSQAIVTGNLVIKTLDDAGAGITLTDAGNDVDTIDLQTRNAADTANAAGAVSFTDLDGFDVVKISTTAGATMIAGDAITQSGSIEAGALVVKTLKDGGAAITLTSAANAVQSIDLRTRNAADTTDAAGTISYRDTDGFDVVKVSTTANSTLNAGAAVTQSGTIAAVGLELLGTGPYTFTNASNDIATLAGNVTNAITYRDANNVTIGTVNTVGLTASDITITVGLQLDQNQKIVTGDLVVKTLDDGGASILLTNSANNADTIDLRTRNAADTANAAGTISYRDVDGFDVVKISTTANATLQSGTAVTQSGSIEAAGLELLGSGPYTLNITGNAITTLAANVTGNVQYRDSDALAIGTVNTAGVSAANVTLVAGGAITQSQAISTGALVARTLNDTGAAITLNTITNAATSIDLRTRNAADTANVAGVIDYKDVDGIDIAKISTTDIARIFAGNAITQSGSIESGTLLAVTNNNAGAAITLTNSANAVTSLALFSLDTTSTVATAGTISYRDTDGFDVFQIATLANVTLNAGGAVTQSTFFIQAAGLELLGTGSYELLSAVNTPAVIASNVTGSVAYRALGAVEVGTVNTVGLTAANVTLIGGGAITQSQIISTGALAAKTRNDAGEDITLTNASNAVTSIDLRSRNAADTANAAGTISFRDSDGFDVVKISTTDNATLRSGGAVTESGTIEVAGLELLGTGPYSLNNAGNAITTLAANVTGNVQYRDSDALVVGTVNTIGVTAANVTLVAGNAITQTQAISTAALVAKTLNNAGAAITLNNTSNAATSVDLRTRNAADTTNVAGAIDYRDIDGIDIVKISTTDTALIRTGDAVTQSGSIEADRLTVITSNNAGAAITLTNPANAVSSVGLFTLDSTSTTATAGSISYRDSDGFNVLQIATLANVTLNAGGLVTQSPFFIDAAGLELLGTGSYELTSSFNTPSTIAGNVTGSVQYTTDGTLSVGTVNTVGLTASSVTLIAKDAITQTQAITTGALAAKTLNNAGANITLTNPANAVASIDLRSRNAADTVNAAGILSFRDSDGFDVVKVATSADTTLRSGGVVTESGTIETAGLELLGSGSYALTNSGNAVTTLAGNVTGAVDYTDSNSLTVDTVNTVGLTAGSIKIVTQSGNLNINQALVTNQVAGIVLQSNQIAINAPIMTTGNGSVTITNAGLLSITAVGDMNLDGAFLQNGIGNVQTAGDITTTGHNIQFQQGVALATSVLFSTGAAGGNIQFDKTLDGTAPGAQNLTLTAGSGNVVFAGAVGTGVRLGTVSIANANDVTVSTGLRATSFTQSTGAGTTTLNGPVDVTTGPGLNLTNTNVAVNAAVTSNGQQVNLTGLQNVSFGVAGSISSTGASVNVIADGAAGDHSGTLTMLNGSSIDAGGASIDLTSDGLMSLGRISTAGGEVHLTSTSSGLVDNNTIGDDITASALAIRAAAGVQNGGTLSTAVSTLAAQNTLSGGLQFSNSLASGLSIGTVNGLTGINNSGPGGAISVISAGPMSVDGAVTNMAGGSITLQTTTGDLTTNARVAATGGSGNLTLAAAQNLLLNDTGFTPDIQTTGSGVITGTAGGSVLFAPNVMAQSGIGQVTDIPPNLANVFAPQITSEGLAQLFADIGRLQELDFTVSVNWSDGTIDIVGYTPPGSISLQHFYDRNPNENNPAAPIPVTVTLFGARNINFPGQNATTVQLFLTNPGDGSRARIDISAKVPILTFPRPTRVDGTSSTSASLPQAAQTQIVERLTAEGNKEVLRQVFLEILSQLPQNAVGDQPERVQLPESVLDDLSTLFKRLPDGRYRLILLEAGETQGRVLLEIDLRQHKISDSFEEGQRETPTEPEPVSPQSRIDSPREPTEAIASMPLADFLLPAAGNSQVADKATATAVTQEQQRLWPRLIGGTVLSASLLMRRKTANWAEEVDTALEQEVTGARKSGSRLIRRLKSALAGVGSAKGRK